MCPDREGQKRLDIDMANSYLVNQMTAKELRAALKRLGMTQGQAAKYLGVSTGAVSLWVNGHRRITGPTALAIQLSLEQLK